MLNLKGGFGCHAIRVLHGESFRFLTEFLVHIQCSPDSTRDAHRKKALLKKKKKHSFQELCFLGHSLGRSILT